MPSKFSGTFVDDAAHGIAIVTEANNKIYQEIYEKGELVSRLEISNN